MQKILAILGPTATGKTDFGIYLAQKYNGEIVSCDSRQVYKGLDIGSGKMPNISSKFKIKNSKWEIDGIDIWMLDVADPKIQYSVKDYIDKASKVIEEIILRDKLPIVVGGTGLYFKALTEGLDYLDLPIDKSARKRYERFSLVKLQEKLKNSYPKKWRDLNNSERHNKRRLIRHLEILTMNPYKDKSSSPNSKPPSYDILKIGLTVPRPVLNSRIDDRLDARLNVGLLKEVEGLYKNGLSEDRLKSLGLEYGVLIDVVTQKISEKVAVDILKIKIHQFAKRQMTWFKKDQEIIWFDITSQDYQIKLENMVSSWYH
ncbi:MAG: tRNA (adenosine(37)-N6)-dimethylallyltransferase MiaA [Candidatus Daviesbacteria bacterium]|nr:tRNA (adenosine(37)-N6)-dimethylallyltransferase MiaA [Candidatus Daviesbacteria bacterium]